MATSEEVKSYQKIHDCSLHEAKTAIMRSEFCDELRSDNTISDITDTLIRILDFEFGGYSH